MWQRMAGLSNAEADRIHGAAMEILGDVGVAFHEPEALEIFRARGFGVEGKTVFFREDQLMACLSTAPSRFVVHAKNPEKNVRIGGKDFALLPGWGAPFIIDPDGEQRPANMADYTDFCKLVHTSPFLDMMGFLTVMPSDISPAHSHLDMCLANLLLTDKASMASPQARDNLEMLAIFRGGRDKIQNLPVTVSKINPVSPLIYAEEMAGALIEYARMGQPLQFPSAAMAGTSAPVTLAGTLALITAEILAGVALVQLINPGTPCVFGGNTTASDMRTGAMALGGPEAIVLIRGITDMARFYGLPCKAGGSVTDAFFPDMQAGVESGISLFTALASGVNMLDQSCGILACFNAMSFEKFLIDEETCGYVRRVLTPMAVNDHTLALDQIKRAGIGGAFLTFPETFNGFKKEFFIPRLAVRGGYEKWRENGKQEMWERAAAYKAERLAAYERPGIDPAIEKELTAYVEKRKAQIPG
ncbi:MAG: trimethylamine methyltransferase family protein [Desulfobacter sp.]